MTSQIYFNGEFYDCLITSGPGESPTTHPQNWSRVEIPRDAAAFMVQKSTALLQSADGQEDKRRAAEREAAQILSLAITTMSRNRTHPNSMRVLTR
jgi:hypothetical protein